jgi:ketosteroid isomerase-like protein
MVERLEIERRLRELYEARLRGDLNGASRLFAPDARFDIAGASQASPVAVKSAGIEEVRALLRLMIKSFTLRDQAILSMLIDCNNAAVHWRAKVHSRITGTTVPTELMDLVQIGEDCRIVRFSEFFIPRYL